MSVESNSGVADSWGNGDSVRSVARAFQLLTLFDREHQQRHVRDLAALTAIPRTTVLRLLSTLESHGFVLQVAESTYQVGPGALRWFQLVQQAWAIPGNVQEAISAVRDKTGESVNIYVRQGNRRVSIGQAEGNRTVRSVVGIGVPLPLTEGSSGTILLAHATSELVASVTSTSEAAKMLATKLESFSKDGFVVSHGERESGASSVSLPLRCTNGTTVALSISGPTSRFDEERIAEYIKTGVRAAKKIEKFGLGPVEALLSLE